ncbi:hypothetical protein WA158_005431 [Blastocystis sp. Blastoise]
MIDFPYYTTSRKNVSYIIKSQILEADPSIDLSDLNSFCSNYDNTRKQLQDLSSIPTHIIKQLVEEFVYYISIIESVMPYQFDSNEPPLLDVITGTRSFEEAISLLRYIKQFINPCLDHNEMSPELTNDGLDMYENLFFGCFYILYGGSIEIQLNDYTKSGLFYKIYTYLSDASSYIENNIRLYNKSYYFIIKSQITASPSLSPSPSSPPQYNSLDPYFKTEDKSSIQCRYNECQNNIINCSQRTQEILKNCRLLLEENSIIMNNTDYSPFTKDWKELYTRYAFIYEELFASLKLAMNKMNELHINSNSNVSSSIHFFEFPDILKLSTYNDNDIYCVSPLSHPFATSKTIIQIHNNISDYKLSISKTLVNIEKDIQRSKQELNHYFQTESIPDIIDCDYPSISFVDMIYNRCNTIIYLGDIQTLEQFQSSICELKYGINEIYESLAIGVIQDQQDYSQYIQIYGSLWTQNCPSSWNTSVITQISSIANIYQSYKKEDEELYKRVQYLHNVNILNHVNKSYFHSFITPINSTQQRLRDIAKSAYKNINVYLTERETVFSSVKIFPSQLLSYHDHFSRLSDAETIQSAKDSLRNTLKQNEYIIKTELQKQGEYLTFLYAKIKEYQLSNSKQRKEIRLLLNKYLLYSSTYIDIYTKYLTRYYNYLSMLKIIQDLKVDIHEHILLRKQESIDLITIINGQKNTILTSSSSSLSIPSPSEDLDIPSHTKDYQEKHTSNPISIHPTTEMKLSSSSSSFSSSSPSFTDASKAINTIIQNHPVEYLNENKQKNSPIDSQINSPRVTHNNQHISSSSSSSSQLESLLSSLPGFPNLSVLHSPSHPPSSFPTTKALQPPIPPSLSHILSKSTNTNPSTTNIQKNKLESTIQSVSLEEKEEIRELVEKEGFSIFPKGHMSIQAKLNICPVCHAKQ